jgi:hypothetical protein
MKTANTLADLKESSHIVQSGAEARDVLKKSTVAMPRYHNLEQRIGKIESKLETDGTNFRLVDTPYHPFDRLDLRSQKS